ncbi:hypothetical protein QFZ20_004377 [Flavobacterium sp. W4I14]|nr:hypothetical protein [Flavobacterium sp. W4I14]
MKRNIRIQLVCIFLGILSLAASCGGKGGVVDQVIENNGCLLTEHKTVGGIADTKVNLFVETSGSMAGFMSAKGTDFQKEIWSMAEELDSRMKRGFDIFQVRSKSETLQRIDIKDFRRPLNTGGFVSAKSTDIPEMLDSIFSKADNETVSVLVSDLIFSPENGNKAQFGQITTDIKKRFIGVQRASVLLQMTSDFYNKGRVDASPYYIWIVGKAEPVKAVSGIIKAVLEGKVNQVDFGVVLPTSNYSILPSLSQVVNAFPVACSKNGGYYTYREYTDEDEAGLNFWIGVDLSGLPGYMQSVDYLKKHMALEASEASAKLLQIKTVPEVSNNGDKAIVSRLGLTHLFQIKIDQIGGGTELKLNIERAMPAWIDEINLEIEDGKRQKTFGLMRMISGLQAALGKDKTALAYDQPLRIFITKN